MRPPAHNCEEHGLQEAAFAQQRLSEHDEADTGTVGGTATENAEFPPFVVSPTGAVC